MNVYKYFSHLKKYLTNKTIQMVLMGFQFAFYISRHTFTQNIYRFLFSKRQRNARDIFHEPCGAAADEWICISKLFSTATNKTNSNQYCLEEDYVNKGGVISLHNHTHAFEQTNYSLITCLKNTEGKLLRKIFHRPASTISPLIRMTSECDLLDNSTATLDNSTAIISKISFLDVQYHHPHMKTPIILEIPREWCCVGNELFSHIFVLRLLYHQPQPFIFDHMYVLDVMDSNLNTVQLDFNHYIILDSNNYLVSEFILSQKYSQKWLQELS